MVHVASPTPATGIDEIIRHIPRAVEMVTVIIKDLAGDDWRSSMRTGGIFKTIDMQAFH